MTAPPRISVVVSQLGFGGAERQTFELLRSLAGTPWAPSQVICLSDHIEPYGPQIEEFGYPLHIIPRRSSFDLLRLGRLGRLLEEDGADLAHAVSLLASGYTWMARRKIRGRRMLPAVRGTVVHPKIFKRWTYARMFRGCPRVLVNSECGARFIVNHLGAVEEHIAIVPNGLDFPRLREQSLQGVLRRELGLTGAMPVLGFVGKNSPVKNVPRLIEIARRLLPAEPSLHVVLVGHGLGESARGALAPDLPSERVHFLGPREDVPALLREMDVLALTSNSEGCPNVVLEALGLGTPVVAANVGDVAKILHSEQWGAVVPPMEIEAYVAAIRRILQRPEAYRRQVEGSWRDLEEHFGTARMVEQTVSLWKEILGFSLDYS